MPDFILPVTELSRPPRPPHDYFNATERKNYNPNYSQPGDPAGHKGVDLKARHGSPVVATARGPVHAAGFLNGPAGDGVEIWHRDLQHLSRMLHMSEVYVHVGEIVEQGQLIGRVGDSGVGTKYPHVHFEIRKVTNYRPSWSGVRQGIPLDPLSFDILESGAGESVEIVIIRPIIARFRPPYVFSADAQDAQSLLANRELIDVGDVNWNDDSKTFDGLAGPSTQSAVKAFQRLVGIPETGSLDSPTWAALSSSP